MMSEWLNSFLEAHEPWQRALWTLIEVVVAAIPVASLGLPLWLVAPLSAGFAHVKSAAAKRATEPWV